MVTRTDAGDGVGLPGGGDTAETVETVYGGYRKGHKDRLAAEAYAADLLGDVTAGRTGPECVLIVTDGYAAAVVVADTGGQPFTRDLYRGER